MNRRTLSLDPGSLDRRLTLEEPSRSHDEAGGHATAWLAVAEFWASVTPVGSSIEFIARADEASTQYEIIIRMRGDVVAGMRLRGAGAAYLISTVRDADGTGRYLRLTAQGVEAE